MPKPFYVTTPIYYVNARPHLGHAYTTIVADVITRFHTMRPAEVYFLTGTDEHGDKVVRAAKKENISPRAYVDKISQLFRDLWPELNISNNYFIRTTDAAHMEIVSQILQKIYDGDDIYFSEYKCLYCFGCERFYTDRELVDGKCPDHEVEPETIKESNYFFGMSQYQEWLIDHIQRNPDFIRPDRYRNEVLAFLNKLDTLGITSMLVLHFDIFVMILSSFLSFVLKPNPTESLNEIRLSSPFISISYFSFDITVLPLMVETEGFFFLIFETTPNLSSKSEIPVARSLLTVVNPTKSEPLDVLSATKPSVSNRPLK